MSRVPGPWTGLRARRPHRRLGAKFWQGLKGGQQIAPTSFAILLAKPGLWYFSLIQTLKEGAQNTQ